MEIPIFLCCSLGPRSVQPVHYPVRDLKLCVGCWWLLRQCWQWLDGGIFRALWWKSHNDHTPRHDVQHLWQGQRQLVRLQQHSAAILRLFVKKFRSKLLNTTFFVPVCSTQVARRSLQTVLQGGWRWLVVQPLPLSQSQRSILHRRSLHAQHGQAWHRWRCGVDELEGQLVFTQGHEHEDQALLRALQINTTGDVDTRQTANGQHERNTRTHLRVMNFSSKRTKVSQWV